jgi:hypothetical protein
MESIPQDQRQAEQYGKELNAFVYRSRQIEKTNTCIVLAIYLQDDATSRIFHKPLRQKDSLLDLERLVPVAVQV